MNYTTAPTDITDMLRGKNSQFLLSFSLKTVTFSENLQYTRYQSLKCYMPVCNTGIMSTSHHKTNFQRIRCLFHAFCLLVMGLTLREEAKHFFFFMFASLVHYIKN